MDNNLVDRSNSLATIDYEGILKVVDEKIKDIEINLENERLDFSNIDIVINDIIDKINKENHSVLRMLDIDKTKKPLDITTFHKDKDIFIKSIAHINEQIKSKIKNSLGEEYRIPLSMLSKYKDNISKKKCNFGLNYDFSEKMLTKQKISFNNKDKSTERLRVDVVEIELSVKDVERAIKENLINYLKNNDMDEELLDERIDDVKNGERGVNNVIKTINDDSLARIKRTVSYLYLEYLLENSNEEHKGFIYLKDYVRRFHLLDEYLQQLSSESDENSLINIEGREFNISNLLSTGEAFNSLPLIGIVDGTILEDRDEEKKKFKIALKLKFNGRVKIDNCSSSSQYWLKYITGELSYHFIRNDKRLISFFLYSFMFYKIGDFNHDPIDKWKELKESINKNGFDEITKKFKSNFDKKDTEYNINLMKGLLEETVKYKGLKKSFKNYTRTLILYNGIITDDIEGSTLFKNFDYNTTMLQYVSIVKKEENPSNILLSIPLNITIQSNKLYKSGKSEVTNLVYELDNYKSIPIVFYPMPLSTKRGDYSKRLKEYFKELKSDYFISIPHTIDDKFFDKGNDNTENCYLYKFIYTNIVYMFLHTLLEMCVEGDKKNIFIPIIRFHFSVDNEFDIFIRSVSKSLEHLLSIDYRASSQGFNVKNKAPVNYIYKNAAASLYSKIPKIFKDNMKHDIKKLAMIIVTSRKCDSVSKNPNSINMLIGEVVLFDAMEDGRVKCDSFGTFGDNYSIDEIYNHPIVLNDLVGDLHRKGYKDILYIAKAPYTSKLNITTEEENLYFMNEKVLETMLSEKGGLMIYPLYYEHFHAIDYIEEDDKEALYVKDTRELDENLTNLNKSVAGVFNLYSGKIIRNQAEEKRYRSIILYSTLCNKYKDNVLNEKLYRALIDNSTFKDNFTNLITLFHYSRYESDINITIKMNPFDKLMGDDGVASNCVYEFRFKNGMKIKYNSLAFLLEVKKILDRDRAYGSK